ncbi:MAG TPA: replication-associated recombination protein A, partial [Roseomonas sp.]
RFNRAQQDGFLPVVEDGTVVLVGATTENPSFALNGALLSRCRVMVLKRLDDPALESLLIRAEAEAGAPLPLDAAARAALRAMADGDGRSLLNMAEQVQALPEGTAPLDPTSLSALLARRAARYDSDRAEHDSQITPSITGDRGSELNGLLSAFHKSLRGSDVQAALYYAARMMVMGEETAPTIFRRLACAASEDVGMADPQALVQVLTAWDAFRRVGWPEAHLFMGQAVVYVATAPKSNATHLAFTQALQLAERTARLQPPLHILNAHTKLLADLGHGAGYRYDHDEPDAFAGQEFFPDALAGENRPELYQPTPRGFERDIGKRLDFWTRRRGRP